MLSILAFAVHCRPALADPPSVHEITMAAPDIVRIEVREAPVRRGRIVKLSGPAGKSGESYTLPDGQRGVVIGPKGDHLRVADQADIEFLDRRAVDHAAAYGRIGKRRVTAVYRKSMPWNNGVAYNGLWAKNPKPVVSFAHFIYLALDAPLSPGAHTITWPDGTLPPTRFTYDDRKTRASSIHATQLGNRPDDVSKYAYLSLWLPGGPENGAVDFRRYGVKRFEVLDAAGKTAFADDVALRMGPTDKEPGDGIGGKLVKYKRADGTTYEANRAGTYVFGLDFSAWRNPPPGRYRLRIPGLGVSDPFDIADDVWHRAAQASMAGLYNQRSGIALDGRFGYTRPEAFTQKSGVTVYQSKLPLPLITDQRGGMVKFSAGARPPWVTDEALPDAWGGYQDAGDWDRIIAHVTVSYILLDIYEMLPEAARKRGYDIPASGDVLNDPLYKGKDFPDLVDEAVWNLDFFRRLQRPDGGVPGGVESGGGPKKLEPSWLESNPVFAYAPDPDSSWQYAAGAAKLAIVFEQMDEVKLADLFRRSARRAWDWAERAAADPKIAYGDAMAILGPDNKALKKRLDALSQKPSDSRLWAAAALYRLTGEKRFNDAVIERFRKSVDMQKLRAHAGWEYRRARWKDRNPVVLTQTERGIKRVAGDFIVKPQRKNAYRNLKHAFAPMGWGEGTAPNANEAMAVIRAYRLTHEKKYLAAMLDASAHILGANQLGISFTIGLGRRWPQAPLHEDSIAMGVPAPTGITIYGWAPAWQANYKWLFGRDWAPLSDAVPTKRIEPYRLSMPVYEYLVDYPRLINSAEYTVAQTIVTTAAMWAFLDGYDRGPSQR